MEKKVISTTNAPKAIGPYSQAVLAGNILFVSGQIPLDPNTMQIVSSDIRGQTKQVMENLKAILVEAMYDFNDVCKTTIYIKNMNDFAIINEIYSDVK